MNIIIVGEVFEDKFIYGECKRMTSEAPVPVFNIIDQTINKGGAGNVYENCINISPESNIRLFAQKTNILKTRIIDKKSNHMFIRIDDEPVIDKFILNDKPLYETDLNNVNFQEVLDGFSRLNPRISVTKNKLLSEERLRELDEAGALRTDIAKLGKSAGDYSVYNIGSDGKPIIVEKPIVPTREDTLKILSDYIVKRKYHETLFESDTLGTCGFDAEVQYNRLRVLNYYYEPITKIVDK